MKQYMRKYLIQEIGNISMKEASAEVEEWEEFYCGPLRYEEFEMLFCKAWNYGVEKECSNWLYEKAVKHDDEAISELFTASHGKFLEMLGIEMFDISVNEEVVQPDVRGLSYHRMQEKKHPRRSRFERDATRRTAGYMKNLKKTSNGSAHKIKGEVMPSTWVGNSQAEKSWRHAAGTNCSQLKATALWAMT